ncbi:MAG: 16S rRNA (guanine(966)-N(2))-methyltransferase RsmD [Candidatus Omnitrophica bacterium]|nr:16S rRNA (guanine(966)-N(2))-methyltransferase RsmD [Candidatus Omnitrophota bacterium]MCF7876856.1 16S rRNA (guanine(966)-N(2))-methyltransferase RsmD [Candidatus Omnitrophota bacterium]MCF7877885.1 16S rRNA (guanine(966)-N(2))-methyltransferase RsmD [Candidatus Omnitrophota bacterium]MCF7892577.1 16S rRNA (guanine(966)-N(2))-methyltransferase RsmD [Candidatus Omnitrophota bacterium]
MQVLAGKLKGRKIEAPLGIRPVSQRLKKSCFDIITELVEAKTVLDLYAGSGALGIEALSQGAAQAVFVDKSKRSLKAVSNNLTGLKLKGQAKVYCKKSPLAVKYFYRKGSFFDIIFLDPPYSQGLLTKSLQLLESYDILARPGYLIGFCSKKDNYNKEYSKFFLILDRGYGQSRLLIYRKK